MHAGLASRLDAVLANRVAKHTLCDVGQVEDTSIPTHVSVAGVFQLEENEQTVTTTARMRKIDLNLRDTGSQTEEVIADRVAAHPDKTKHHMGNALHQRDIQRQWGL